MRRVSFSRTTEVKEFVAGSIELTMWKSAYEEVNSTTDQSSSSKCETATSSEDNDEVFLPSSAGNDKMNTTTFIEPDEENNDTFEAFMKTRGPRSDGLLGEGEIEKSGWSMDLTCVLGQKQMGASASETELGHQVDNNKTTMAPVMMDVSFNSANLTSNVLDRVGDDMEISAAVPLSRLDDPLNKKNAADRMGPTLQALSGSDKSGADMEMTCALLSKQNLKQTKQGPREFEDQNQNSDNFGGKPASIASVKVSQSKNKIHSEFRTEPSKFQERIGMHPPNDMEMTCAVPSQISVGIEIGPAQQKFKDTAEMDKSTKVNETSCADERPNEDMEMTGCAAPQKLKVDQTKDAARLHSHLKTENNGQSNGNNRSSARIAPASNDMEMTCAVPSRLPVRKMGQKLQLSEPLSKIKSIENALVRSELTTEEMEMTCAVSLKHSAQVAQNRHSSANPNKISEGTSFPTAKLADEEMEMTCAVSFKRVADQSNDFHPRADYEDPLRPIDVISPPEDFVELTLAEQQLSVLEEGHTHLQPGASVPETELSSNHQLPVFDMEVTCTIPSSTREAPLAEKNETCIPKDGISRGVVEQTNKDVEVISAVPLQQTCSLSNDQSGHVYDVQLHQNENEKVHHCEVSDGPPSHDNEQAGSLPAGIIINGRAESISQFAASANSMEEESNKALELSRPAEELKHHFDKVLRIDEERTEDDQLKDVASKTLPCLNEEALSDEVSCFRNVPAQIELSLPPGQMHLKRFGEDMDKVCSVPIKQSTSKQPDYQTAPGKDPAPVKSVSGILDAADTDALKRLKNDAAIFSAVEKRAVSGSIDSDHSGMRTAYFADAAMQEVNDIAMNASSLKEHGSKGSGISSGRVPSKIQKSEDESRGDDASKRKQRQCCMSEGSYFGRKVLEVPSVAPIKSVVDDGWLKDMKELNQMLDCMEGHLGLANHSQSSNKHQTVAPVSIFEYLNQDQRSLFQKANRFLSRQRESENHVGGKAEPVPIWWDKWWIIRFGDWTYRELSDDCNIDQGKHVNRVFRINFPVLDIDLDVTLGLPMTLEKLDPSTSVSHWTLLDIRWVLPTRIQAKTPFGKFNSYKLVHHLLLKKLTPDVLASMCPTTRQLRTTLEALSRSATEAFCFFCDLRAIAGSHSQVVVTDDFRIRVRFHSVKLAFSFKISVNFEDGLSAAKELEVEYERGPSLTNLVDKETIKLIASRTSANRWRYFKALVANVDLYIKELEQLALSQD